MTCWPQALPATPSRTDQNDLRGEQDLYSKGSLGVQKRRVVELRWAPGLVSVELHRIGQGRSPCGHCRILSSRSHSMEAEEKNRTQPAMGQSDITHGAASLHSNAEQT